MLPVADTRSVPLLNYNPFPNTSFVFDWVLVFGLGLVLVLVLFGLVGVLVFQDRAVFV